MNGISGISFGARVSLQNDSLYKHVDVDIRNKFSKSTDNIPGIMTLRKTNNRGIRAVLNGDRIHALTISADDFYRRDNTGKARVLKKMAQYMNALDTFYLNDEYNRYSYSGASKAMIKRQIKRLDKIVGKETAFMPKHQEIKQQLQNRLLEIEVFHK